jgi:transcription elongation factor GreA
VILTRGRERALRAELASLRRQVDVDFTSRLSAARSFGEAGSNDEYLQIKEEEAVVAARIARLEDLLGSAEVVNEVCSGEGSAGLGSRITVEHLDSGVIAELRLIGDYEPRDAGGVSANSPFGRALLGRGAGEEVEVELPNGSRKQLRVVSVSSGG